MVQSDIFFYSCRSETTAVEEPTHAASVSQKTSGNAAASKIIKDVTYTNKSDKI